MTEPLNIKERDKTEGRCEGECRDRVNEGREDRQAQIEAESKEEFENPEEEYPEGPEHTRSRKEQPAVFGGRV